MKKLIVLSIVALLSCMAVMAQDARLAGTWKDSERLPLNDDYYIRIDIEDGEVYVRTKVEGLTIDGKDFKARYEAENVVVNNDGSVSFDVYKDKLTYDSEDHLYWTIWTHYTVKYRGGRLLSTEKTYSLGYDSNGHIVEDYSDRTGGKSITYYNEKDNW